MTFTVTPLAGGGLHIVIEGELDAVTAAEVRKDVDQVCASNPPRVEIDLSTLRMIDSSGVGTLVSIYKRVRAQGGEVVMVGLRDQPLAIFRLLRLDQVMASRDVPGVVASAPRAGR